MSEPCKDADLAALAERIAALDRLMQAELKALSASIEKAEVKIDERFRSHNEFREQIREERSTVVTRTEIQAAHAAAAITVRWVIGLTIAVALAVAGLYMKR